MASGAVALVTGGSGFVGRYVVAALEAAGRTVVALSSGQGHPGPPGPWPPASQASPRACDITDRAAVARMVAEVAPTEVYHLASLTRADDPALFYQTHVMGSLFLLDAVRRQAPRARVIVASSAQVYGGGASPVAEAAPLEPATPYAASLAASELIAIQHAKAYGLEVVRARVFESLGPGQGARFAVSGLARQIARSEIGRQASVLPVSKLEARHDFLDVRDLASAYLALAAHGEAGGVYNVCSGQAVSLGEVLHGLLAHAKVGITLEVEPGEPMPLAEAERLGDPRALLAASGWQARIPLERTLLDMLSYWRAQEPFVGDPGPSFA